MNNKTMKEEKKPGYWQKEASVFANYYTPFKYFSFKKNVANFLNARTEILLSQAAPHPNDTLLDLGCGSGIHITMFASRCKQIIGADYSLQMLSIAKNQCRDLEKENWALSLANAQELPFKDNNFNGIISMGLLDYVSSMQEVLLECHRVLKDPGFIIFSIPKSPSLFFFLRTKIGNVIKKHLFNLPPIKNTITKTALSDLMQRTGFRIEYLKPIWTTMWIVKAIKTNKI